MIISEACLLPTYISSMNCLFAPLWTILPQPEKNNEMMEYIKIFIVGVLRSKIIGDFFSSII